MPFRVISGAAAIAFCIAAAWFGYRYGPAEPESAGQVANERASERGTTRRAPQGNIDQPSGSGPLEPADEPLEQAIREFYAGEAAPSTDPAATPDRSGVDPTRAPRTLPPEPETLEDTRSEAVRQATAHRRRQQLDLVTVLAGRVERAIEDARENGNEDELHELTTTAERLSIRRANIERAMEEGR